MEGTNVIRVVYVKNIDSAKLRDGQCPEIMVSWFRVCGFSQKVYYISAGNGKWICEKQSSQINKKLQILRDGVRYFFL